MRLCLEKVTAFFGDGRGGGGVGDMLWVWCWVRVDMFILPGHYFLLRTRALVQVHDAVKPQCAWCFEVNNMFMLTSNNV